MSSRFMIEMPTKKMSWETFILMASGGLFMAGPIIALASVIGDSRLPVAVALLLVLSTVFGLVCGMAFIRSEIRRQQSRRAERHLKSAIQRMGYIALEPIEVHGKKDRVLLRDDRESALWDVSVTRNKVVCAKRT